MGNRQPAPLEKGAEYRIKNRFQIQNPKLFGVCLFGIYLGFGALNLVLTPPWRGYVPLMACENSMKCPLFFLPGKLAR